MNSKETLNEEKHYQDIACCFNKDFEDFIEKYDDLSSHLLCHMIICIGAKYAYNLAPNHEEAKSVVEAACNEGLRMSRENVCPTCGHDSLGGRNE